MVNRKVESTLPTHSHIQPRLWQIISRRFDKVVRNRLSLREKGEKKKKFEISTKSKRKLRLFHDVE